jgi:nucleotide-binding universal stress UspA family protein
VERTPPASVVAVRPGCGELLTVRRRWTDAGRRPGRDPERQQGGQPIYRKIIVGYDGSERAQDALVLAKLLTDASGAELVVAGVFEFDPRWGGRGPRYREAEAKYARVIEAAAAAVGAEPEAMPSSSIGRGLHELAEETDADLIVVGSSHRSRAGQVLAGNVGQSLLHGSGRWGLLQENKGERPSRSPLGDGKAWGRPGERPEKPRALFAGDLPRPDSALPAAELDDGLGGRHEVPVPGRRPPGAVGRRHDQVRVPLTHVLHRRGAGAAAPSARGGEQEQGQAAHAPHQAPTGSLIEPGMRSAHGAAREHHRTTIRGTDRVDNRSGHPINGAWPLATDRSH